MGLRDERKKGRVSVTDHNDDDDLEPGRKRNIMMTAYIMVFAAMMVVVVGCSRIKTKRNERKH